VAIKVEWDDGRSNGMIGTVRVENGDRILPKRRLDHGHLLQSPHGTHA
jgi:hypothetical protein